MIFTDRRSACNIFGSGMPVLAAVGPSPAARNAEGGAMFHRLGAVDQCRDQGPGNSARPAAMGSINPPSAKIRPSWRCGKEDHFLPGDHIRRYAGERPGGIPQSCDAGPVIAGIG
ncbi:MAG: hypothetical protein ACYDCW_12340 [Acidithiobacillus ferrivorans]